MNSFNVFILVLSFSGASYAMSCAQPAVERCANSNELKQLECILADKIDSANWVTSSKVQAESCVLSHKLNRREYLQSQCKATAEYGEAGCGGFQWRCLPNGNEGQIWDDSNQKLFANAKEFNEVPKFLGSFYSVTRICKQGKWQTYSGSN